MMKLILLLLSLLGLSSSQSNNAQSDGTTCKLTILKQLANGRLFSDTLNLSGKYLNELGNYNDCMKQTMAVANGTQTDLMKYELKVYTSDKREDQFNMQFVIGLCTFSMCSDDSLTAFDTFYI
jgi:hypothetical protein